MMAKGTEMASVLGMIEHAEYLVVFSVMSEAFRLLRFPDTFSRYFISILLFKSKRQARTCQLSMSTSAEA